MGINRILLLSLLFIGIWFSYLEMCIPLFLLLLKPFFTREAFYNIKFSRKREKTVGKMAQQVPETEKFLVTKIYYYWLNLIYPEK